MKKTNVQVDINNIINDNKITNQKNFIIKKNLIKMAKSKNLIKIKNHDFSPNSKNMDTKLGFLTLKARLAFIK